MAGKVYIFLGPPGAGKGTQAIRLANDIDAVYFSTGEYFRQQIKMRTPLGLKVKDIIESGKLVPNIDEVVIDFFRKNQDKDFILDGFPRNLKQDKEIFQIAVNKFGLSVIAVFYLKVLDAEIINRLSARRTCTSCGRMYNMIYTKPRRDERCDYCNSELMKRSDDEPEVIRERLKVYRRETEPLVEYFREKGKLVELDGAAPIEDIYRRIKSKVTR
jgi:adenylate kinase